MIIQIFSPLISDADTFAGNKLGDITKVIKYSQKENFFGIGKFDLTIAAATLFSDKIEEDTLLYVDYTDWLVVTGVVEENGLLEIAGTDLKGYLDNRITLYGGTEQDTGTGGYDVIKGSTETVLKHYINNNLVNPLDSGRKIVGMTVAEDRLRGIAADTYMARLENVATLAEKVCKNGKIGYSIGVNLAANKFIFDVTEPIDKTVGQAERNRVVFAVERKNIANIKFERSIKDSKNAFYATKSGSSSDADALTQLVLREGDTAPTGIKRREMQLTVSCEGVSEMEKYARKDMKNYEDINSFEAEIKGYDEYRDIYNIGDIITIVRGDITVDTQITEAVRTITQNSKTLSLTFGNKKPKLLKQIETMIQKTYYSKLT